ncbi:MFS transporter, sugar porter (SP) family [Methylobacterium sp. UNC378MF]|uniref:sugar porter family MFS transporter n=1 Tax=Methylobacterium sp. UNC378MF TaxID=1502748 RepID=UPI00088BED3C|nr:sugar porter family MFS transporter [Methylobacterium sp. UNC378MF]SDA15492.1 MFS transporter, sugar porter (SP) family [Methylobacterium sp. UNC378MF]
MTPFMWLAAATAAIGGFLYGYDTGIIAGALLSITADFALPHAMQEIVAAAILFGATLGGLGTGVVSDRFGRRHTIIGIAALFTLGAVAASLAPDAILLALARVVLGIAVGAASQSIPAYVAELAPAEHRGRLVVAFSVAIGLGILTASLVGYGLHDVLSWRLMIAAGAVPAIVLFAAMFALPESPRWLVAQGRRDAAHRALARVRPGGADLDGELDGISDAIAQSDTSTPGWRGLADQWVRPAVIAGCGTAAFTQLVGIEMMIYYAPTLLKGLGFGEGSALLTNVGIAAIYLVMTATGLAIVDRVGRRRLSLVTLPGAALSLAVLGALFATGRTGPEDAPFVIGCLFSFMMFQAGGLQVIGWLTGSEVYPLRVRAAGTSAQAATVWGSNLLLTGTALSLIHHLGAGGAMWVYAGLNALAFVFVWRWLPELKGRSLEEVEDALRQNQFTPAHFAAEPVRFGDVRATA